MSEIPILKSSSSPSFDLNEEPDPIVEFHPDYPAPSDPYTSPNELREVICIQMSGSLPNNDCEWLCWKAQFRNEGMELSTRNLALRPYFYEVAFISIMEYASQFAPNSQITIKATNITSQYFQQLARDCNTSLIDREPYRSLFLDLCSILQERLNGKCITISYTYPEPHEEPPNFKQLLKFRYGLENYFGMTFQNHGFFEFVQLLRAQRGPLNKRRFTYDWEDYSKRGDFVPRKRVRVRRKGGDSKSKGTKKETMKRKRK
ncbi:hypothetical protein P9112_009328 [Eukaryota sp. TZLM1-RC]